MLRLQNVTKSFGEHLLLDDVSFLMSPGERLGLVGRNGQGKTTLFRVIQGEEVVDNGRVHLPTGYRVGYLRQRLEFCRESILEEAVEALPIGEGGEVQGYRAEAALMGLGFSRDDLSRPAAEFSGGYQIRVELARVLLCEPNLLLLDEPTNYLDIVSVRWLQKLLSSWRGELIIISHDREFLARVTTHSMMIHRRKLRRMEGSVEKLLEQIGTEEAVHERTRLNAQKKRKQEERFIERFRYKASKASLVQSRIKQLERRGEIDQLEEEADLSFRFEAAPFHATTMMRAEDLSFAYPRGPTLIEQLSFTVERGDRIGVIGKNGKGKTTLLELLAGEIESQTGSLSLNPNVELGYFGQTNIGRLDPELSVEEEVQSVGRELSRSRIRGICGLMMFEGDRALKSIRVLSGGERSRVLLGKLLAKPANLLLLDEPTNHLDLESVESLLESLEEFPGAVIIVTHSEMILRRIARRLIVFDGDRCRVFEGGYRDFLDRQGWAEEREGKDPATCTERGRAPANRKQLRQERAQIRRQRERAVASIQKEVDALEEQIIALEEQLADCERRLCQLATAGSHEEMAEEARKSKELRSAVERLFEELEERSKQLAQEAAVFDRRLEELEGDC